jgi:hypothetical protein
MKIILMGFLLIFSIHKAIAQSVSLGTKSPHPSALLDINSTTGGFLIPRMTTAQRNDITSPPAGLTIYNAGINVFQYYDGDTWRTFIDNDLWSRNGNFVHSSTNDLGLGTAAPAAALDVNGNVRIARGNAYLHLLRYSGTQNSFNFRFTGPGTETIKQGFNFNYNDITKGYLRFNNSNNASDIQFEFGIANGTAGIIKSTGDFVLRATESPAIQLNTNVVEKAFVHISGNDIRMGTNSSNTTGQTIFRADGENKAFMASNGFFKIGDDNPTARLDVDGNILMDGTLKSNGNLETRSISFTSEIRSSNKTGLFNLVPLAYGYVDFAGTVLNATANVNVTRVSKGTYDIVVPGITANVTIIVNGGETITAAYRTANTCRVINYQDLTETLDTPTLADTKFYFIIFQP